MVFSLSLPIVNISTFRVLFYRPGFQIKDLKGGVMVSGKFREDHSLSNLSFLKIIQTLLTT